MGQTGKAPTLWPSMGRFLLAVTEVLQGYSESPSQVPKKRL